MQSLIAPPYAGMLRVPDGLVMHPSGRAERRLVRPKVNSSALRADFVALVGSAPEEFPISTTVGDLALTPGDDVLVEVHDNGLPLIVRRNDVLIVNFDVEMTRAFSFADSKRPLYTYVPHFKVHWVPERLRRQVSNFVHSSRHEGGEDHRTRYRRLPLTSFESVCLQLSLAHRTLRPSSGAVSWPGGKRAAFVALHDVDTAGFLARREADPLFHVERCHQIRATWFIPTSILNRGRYSVDFLLAAGHEVGWHGHLHDHRDHIGKFAHTAVNALASSSLSTQETFPVGMRLPRLLKSNHLFELIDRSCPNLRYDTSFLQGTVPYHLWIHGRQSRILEIPTTVPTDIKVFNELSHLPASQRCESILEAQIARTEALIELGAVITIVTHPERELSERPDFLEVYDRYLAFVRGRQDVWFTTAGELYNYWTSGAAASAPVVAV